MEENERAIKILLVDDERNILDIVQFNLEVEGFEVQAATFNADARGLQREVILKTDPPIRGKNYVLRVTRVKDRSEREARGGKAGLVPGLT